MTTDKPIVQTWHEDNLSIFRSAANGNRNEQLNTQALKSFGLALGDSNLSIAKVEADFTDAAKSLAMADNEVKATLRSALDAASPRAIFDGDKATPAQPTDKRLLIIAPTYTALEDYAIAHGVPVSAFEEAQWKEVDGLRGKCLQVPHEDGVVRVRYLDGETPKWLPIKPSGMKDKIEPCWYGFNRAIVMATGSEHKTLVLCNGQPSVIAAQYHNVPALAQTDGEGKLIEKPLMKRLLIAIKEHKLKVIIAMDGDKTGRKAAQDRREQLQANGVGSVQVAHFGGDDGYDLADYCKQHKSLAMEGLIKLARYGQKKSEPIQGRNQLSNVACKSMMSDKSAMAGEFLIIPFKSFHRLGGFAFVAEPGKMTMIIAPSGGGKTSFMETWSDAWNRKGFDTLWFSPEWSPISMQYRAIQRYSGVTTDSIKRHLLWQMEAERGIAEGDRQGKRITSDSNEFKLFNEANEMISKWPGELYALQGQSVTSEVLEDMGKTIWLARRKGKRIGAAFFDYAQILNTDKNEADRNSYELIMSEIKTWGGELDVHTVVGSQPTKSVADNSINTGALLGAYDGMWVRPDAANLIITLNIKHNKIGDELKKTDYATANICKNSEGQEGQVSLRTNFKYLAWKES